MLMVAIYYSFLHLTVLRSFPTRRSSDLGTGVAGDGPGFPVNVDGERPDLLGGFLEVDQFGVGVGGFTPEDDDRSGDRKSTRLNSSHVKISYAVFCLKKKKQEGDKKEKQT